ncbi:AraC family transcriptional regulator [Saccharibacillus sp. CPCC 101409]|uniref:AraC family transcriptional regulator n=1 Tax=Saccharibacillus sp. CPCC 101409 TaxID=3058041 RepID=UPI002673CD3F|nr:AraC family transcriptional regulator [Saccharibacillus sp. CPCC 101409]MDO3411645.1 AraC family transcriptional regulator [Saccharibacillus sp. CPCC 101409]
MPRFWFRYTLKNTPLRLILLLTAGLSILVLLVAFFSYNHYRKALDLEINTPNVELLQINADVTNREVRAADSGAVDASFHPSVARLLNASAERQPDLAKTTLDYLQTLSLQSDIRAIAVVDFRHGSVLSSDYGYRADWNEAPDRGWSTWIREAESKPLLLKRRTEEGGAANTELLSVVRPVSENGRTIGAVVVDLDYDLLFSKMYLHPNSYQYVYDLDGHRIYPKLESPVPAGEMTQVISQIDVRPFDYVHVLGQDYLANQAFSDATGWRMISLVPMDQLLKNARIARNAMLSLALVSVLAGAAAVSFYSFAAFRPLKRIRNLVASAGGEAAPKTLDELEPVIGKLLGDVSNGRLAVRAGLPELRSKFLQDTLGRRIGATEIRTKWESYFEDWKPGSLYIAVFSIDRYKEWADRYEEEDRRLLHYAMENIALERLGNGWKTAGAREERDSLILLLQPEQPEASAAESAAEIVRTLKEFLGVSVSAGWSGPAAGPGSLPLVYEQAVGALNERLYAGCGRIHAYEYAERRTLPTEEWANTFMEALEAGEEQRSVGLVRGWLESLKRDPARPEDVYDAADRLLRRMIRFCAERGWPLERELGDYTRRQAQTLDLNELGNLLERQALRISEAAAERRSSRERRLTDEMKTYMRDNLPCNIGVQDVAEHVGMGVSSVSSMFKEETGATVYEYLTQIRMDAACELLANGGLKIVEIAQRVGYQNENSFIRAFRKLKDVTPGKYRETHKAMRRSSGEYADPAKAEE